MVDWSYTPPEDSAPSIINAYQSGQQAGQARDKRAALSAYGSQALNGDRAAIGKLAATSPDLATQFAQLANSADEKTRARSLENWDFIGSVLQRPDGTPIQTPEELQHAKTLALARGLPADQIDQVTPDSIPQLIQMSQTARNYARQAQLDAQAKRVGDANIVQSYAAADASRASADRARNGGKAPPGYTWSPDGSTLVAVPGGPNDPARKLTEGQSKDLGYYQRGTKANALMTPSRVGQMINGRNSTVQSIPVFGNSLLSKEARQGHQAAGDFIAALLRKDTGAAVTPQEFEFYANIFIPQYGDDDQTIRQKADSRAQALSSIKQGMGAAQVLADMGIQPTGEGAGAAPAGPQGQPEPSQQQPPGLPPGFRIVQ